jgi:hypothetical protein
VHFVESGVSRQHSQDTATCPSPEPAQPSTCPLSPTFPHVGNKLRHSQQYALRFYISEMPLKFILKLAMYLLLLCSCTRCLQKNGAVSKFNKKFISQLTRANIHHQQRQLYNFFMH